MAKHHKHYAKKLRLGPKNNPAAKSGLLFGLVFGGLMTIVGLAQLLAATVSVSLQPASQNANPNQTKTVSVVVNAPSDTFNGGYVQIGFDSSMLSGVGLEAASSRFAVQQHSFSSSSAVFHFTTTNPGGESGEHAIAIITFTTKQVSGTQTARISGGAVPYKNVGGNPQYFSASSLSANIIIAQGINPTPTPTPTPSPTPTPTPTPAPTPTPTPTPSPTPQPSPSQVPPDNEADNVPIPGVTDGTIPANYGDVPGLFGDQVFGEEGKNSNAALKAFLIIVSGLVIVGGGLWFYKNFPKLAAKRQFKKADSKRPVSDNSQSHSPEEVRPTGESTDKPMPSTPPPISHHATHAFPEKNKAKSESPKTHSEPPPKPPEHNKPNKPQEPSHTPAAAKTEPAQKPKPEPAPKPQPLPQAKPAESPAKAQEPSKPIPQPASLPKQTQNPAPAVTMAGGIQKPWDDIRKDQAAKIAHAHKDLGADEDLPDMFELAEQHPESFGSQTLYDEETGHSQEPTKKE